MSLEVLVNVMVVQLWDINAVWTSNFLPFDAA